MVMKVMVVIEVMVVYGGDGDDGVDVGDGCDDEGDIDISPSGQCLLPQFHHYSLKFN